MNITSVLHSFLKLILVLSLLYTGCSSADETHNTTRLRNQQGEYIYRKYNENSFSLAPPAKNTPKTYPWDKEQSGNYPLITKEFFRCKGSSLNPCHVVQKQTEILHCYDCGGVDKHSLPLRDGKEFIYPILIELLNHIQATTGKRVVITSGHRCPEHNTYNNADKENQYSKHMIGAEVAFYVQGLEDKPETIVNIIQNFYKTNPRYKGKKDYEVFRRYEKQDTNVSTPPWHNKEIFVKLFAKKEGRDFDNRHPYAYISIQVRYDRDLNQNVNYSWDKAFRNYHRW